MAELARASVCRRLVFEGNEIESRLDDRDTAFSNELDCLDLEPSRIRAHTPSVR